MQKKSQVTNHITNDLSQGTKQHYYGDERGYSYTHLHQMTQLTSETVFTIYSGIRLP